MDFYPAWPPVVAYSVLFALAASPVLGCLVPLRAVHGPRSSGIDGLRGFLALGVVMLHGAIYHRYLVDGVWSGPPSAVYTLLGSGGVAVFFMITGYLFWGKLIDERGRIDWVRLYVGRLFRIGPLYLVMLALMLVLVLQQAGWRLLVTPNELALQIAPWLALGVSDPTDINRHVATLVLTAGVTWSLRYEWLFYLCLPALALLAGRGPARTLLLLALLAGGFAWSFRGGPALLKTDDPSYATLFLIGAACAAVQRAAPVPLIGDRVGSTLVLGLLAALFSTCFAAYTPPAMALLGGCFLLIARGCTVFGVLTHPAARRLGEISYGIYLLQGIVLALVFGCRPLRAFALLSPWRHWMVVLLAMVLLVPLSAVLFRLVEQPGIRCGRRLVETRTPSGTRRRGTGVAIPGRAFRHRVSAGSVRQAP